MCFCIMRAGEYNSLLQDVGTGKTLTVWPLFLMSSIVAFVLAANEVAGCACL